MGEIVRNCVEYIAHADKKDVFANQKIKEHEESIKNNKGGRFKLEVQNFNRHNKTQNPKYIKNLIKDIKLREKTVKFCKLVSEKKWHHQPNSKFISLVDFSEFDQVYKQDWDNGVSLSEQIKLLTESWNGKEFTFHLPTIVKTDPKKVEERKIATEILFPVQWLTEHEGDAMRHQRDEDGDSNSMTRKSFSESKAYLTSGLQSLNLHRDEKCPVNQDLSYDQPHQQILKYAFRPFGPISRILATHRTGSGKTRSIVNVMENYYFSHRRKIVIVPSDTVRFEVFKEIFRPYRSVEKDDDDPSKSRTASRYGKIQMYFKQNGIQGIGHGDLVTNAETGVDDREIDTFNGFFSKKNLLKKYMVDLNNARDNVGEMAGDETRNRNVDRRADLFLEEYKHVTHHHGDTVPAPSAPYLVITFKEMLDSIRYARNTSDLQYIVGTEMMYMQPSNKFHVDFSKINFQNSLIICDEAHKLYLPENAPILELIKAHKYKNMNLGLFTATPVKRGVDELQAYGNDFFFPNESTHDTQAMRDVADETELEKADIWKYVSYYDSGAGNLFKKAVVGKFGVEPTEFYKMRTKLLSKPKSWTDTIVVPFCAAEDVMKPDDSFEIEDLTSEATADGNKELNVFIERNESAFKTNISQLMISDDTIDQYFPMGATILNWIETIRFKRSTWVENNTTTAKVVVMIAGTFGLGYLLRLLRNKNIGHIVYGVQDRNDRFHSSVAFGTKRKNQKTQSAQVFWDEEPNKKDGRGLFDDAHLIDLFNDSTCPVLVYNTQKPQEGVNIFGADDILLAHNYTSASHLMQALGRINRMCHTTKMMLNASDRPNPRRVRPKIKKLSFGNQLKFGKERSTQKTTTLLYMKTDIGTEKIKRLWEDLKLFTTIQEEFQRNAIDSDILKHLTSQSSIEVM
jgi:hypothetical protein